MGASIRQLWFGKSIEDRPKNSPEKNYLKWICTSSKFIGYFRLVELPDPYHWTDRRAMEFWIHKHIVKAIISISSYLKIYNKNCKNHETGPTIRVIFLCMRDWSHKDQPLEILDRPHLSKITCPFKGKTWQM